MIASDIDRSEQVIPMQTDLPDRLLDHRALSLIESHRIVLELLGFCSLQKGLRRDRYDAPNYMRTATERSAIVAMQPCAVTAECNQVRQREIVVIEVAIRVEELSPP
jgi:hypothetical protein